MCLILACSVYLGNRHMVRTLRQKNHLSLVGLNSLFNSFTNIKGERAQFHVKFALLSKQL